MKRIIPAILISLFCSIGYAEKTIHFIAVTHGEASDPFWSVVKNGMDQAAKDNHVNVQYRAPTSYDMPKEAQMITASVAAHPDGLIVSIPDASALGPAIKTAVSAGIPVISINSGEKSSKKLGALIHIGQSEYTSGFLAGKREIALGVKKGLCINHEPGNSGLEQRCHGFITAFNNKQLKAYLLETSSIDPTDISNAVVAFLNKHKDINGILALGPLSAEPTLAALKKYGMTSHFVLGSFDLSPTILKAIAAGQWSFAIDQQPFLQGYLSVEYMVLYKKYGIIPDSITLTGPSFVTKDNVAQVVKLTKEGIR